MPRIERWIKGSDGLLRRRSRTSRGTEVPTTTPRRFPGDPNPKVTGKTLWGAAVGTNGSASIHEGSGEIMALRRRYWSSLSDWNTGGPMAAACREDHTAGRLPWVSCKIPLESWTSAGNGNFDSYFDQFINEVKAMAPKPVWFSLNHEPENDGGDSGSGWEATAGAGYRAMQRRFRLRMNALGVTNLAFGSSLMYYTFNPVSGRDADAWYPADVNGVPSWDFMGNDHYTEVDQEPDRTNAWTTFVDYSKAKGLPVTMPEWGLRGEDPQGVRKMLKMYDRRVTDDIVGFAYFDSGANSTGSGWVLDNENGLLNEFHRIQALNTSVTFAEMGY